MFFEKHHFYGKNDDNCWRSCKPEDSDEQKPCHSIVGHDCEQVVDGRDERAGCDSRVDMAFFEKERNDSSGQA